MYLEQPRKALAPLLGGHVHMLGDERGDDAALVGPQLESSASSASHCSSGSST